MDRQDPRPSSAVTRMSANLRRIEAFADAALEQLDRAIAASQSEDWGSVQRICEELARAAQTRQSGPLGPLAQRVAHEAGQPEGGHLAARRSLVRLVGTCGRLEATDD